LGVIRLDYNYPPAKGDIDCPASYGYEVIFRMVPGLTFEMAQAGQMTHKVEREFNKAVQDLEQQGVCGITGDCGFMMAFQTLAREAATVPVFLSSMVQCPLISVAFDKYDKILILTANSDTLKPQKEALLSHCGFDVDDERFLIRGCQDVPGFDAVAKGEAVDVEKVTPGIVAMVKKIMREQPDIRAICLECTELPPYADALRAEFDISVFDAITNCDFFISSFKDNPRFGLNQWKNDWDAYITGVVAAKRTGMLMARRLAKIRQTRAHKAAAAEGIFHTSHLDFQGPASSSIATAMFPDQGKVERHGAVTGASSRQGLAGKMKANGLVGIQRPASASRLA